MDSSTPAASGISSNRHLNKRVILDLIRFTPGGVSRSEMARRLSLTRSAISAIVNELVAEDLVREADNGPATGGRRPILLEINPRRGIVAGVDIGVSHVHLTLTDFSAHVLREIELPFDVRLPPEICLSAVDHHLQDLLAQEGIQLDQLIAVGVGVPGPVLPEAGTVVSAPIMPGWDYFPIRDWLQNQWKCPVSLNNDAELGAMGEWAYGAGRSQRNLIYIKVGSGIGAGLILGGRMYRGINGFAGEIGHIQVKENGPRCACGKSGCLEVLAGGQAIARNAIQAVKNGRRTQLAAIKPVESLSARDVASAARLGDLVAQQIVSEAGAHLGTAIAGLINLLNPGMIVVGGGVAQTGDLFLEPLRRAVLERCMRGTAENLRITAAVLGRRSSAMGAVTQALTLGLYGAEILEYGMVDLA